MAPSSAPTFVPAGMLEHTPLPLLLNQIHEAGQTGTLHIESGQVRTWVCFERGFPSGVFIPNSEVYLGMVLRELGYIDDQAFNESLMIMAKTNQRRGQILLNLGKINQEQLGRALMVQMMRKLVELFTIKAGRYRFVENEQMPGQDQPSRIHPYVVIYSGIKNRYQGDELYTILSAMLTGQACRAARGFFERAGLFDLPADEQADAELLREYRSYEEILAKARSGSTSVMMLLYVLLCCGMLEVTNAATAKPIPEVEQPGPSVKPTPPVEGPVSQEPTGKGSAQPEPGTPEPSTERRAQIDDLKRKLKERMVPIRQGDLFGILGVKKGATAEEIKRAHLDLTKHFHPDRVGQLGDEDLLQVAGFVIARVNDAYQVLSNSENFKAIQDGQMSTSGKMNDPSAAMIACEKAKVFINKKKIKEAAEQLRLAAELDPGNAEYQARHLWFDYLQDPARPKEKLVAAKIGLVKLYKDHPGNYFVNRHLASVYKELKDEQHYLFYLEKASEIRPTDIETARELRLFKMRHDKDEFGRKK